MSSTQSRGVNIAGQTLSVDPRTGRTENTGLFSKAAWNEIADPHTVTLTRHDGSNALVTIAGARFKELRDDKLVQSLIAGGRLKHTVSNEEWHQCVMSYARRYPDLVKVTDGYKATRPSLPPRVVVAVIAPNPATVRFK
jgi:hypothetical protein